MDFDPGFSVKLHGYVEEFCRSRSFTFPAHLKESIEYSLLSPGKRFRPRLLLACSEMLGLDSVTVMPSACALEMIHCFTLIHDDLPCMDNSDTRRGRPSNHKKFGESTALLAGDALMTLAVDTFLKTPLPASVVLEGLKRLSEASGPRGVIGGQAAEALLTERSSLEELLRMHAGKTGALFSAALLIPMALAEISETSAEGKLLTEAAERLGRAFQIADDLEDGSAETPPPATSVLAYLAPEKAVELAVHPLRIAQDRLISCWKEPARALTLILQEVDAKLISALGNY